MSEEQVMDVPHDNPKIDELVKVYLTIRDAKSKLYTEYQLKTGQLEEELKQIEIVLLDECDKVGASSIRTSVGTVTRSIKEQYTCSNWDEFKQFVLQQGALELLSQRLQQSNFNEYMLNHSDEGLPPGISSMREYRAAVRRAS